MATNLYEILELSKDATTEQIRKAYKKKALQTHPDRLLPGATPEEKTNSEEEFRKVNNAYEVLSDPQNRRVYDLHGVWPPPEPESSPLPRRSSQSRHRAHSQHRSHNTRSHTFPEPFFGSHHDPFQFAFTDPFALFESIFGDIDAHHHASHFHRHHHRSNTSRHDEFDRAHHQMHSGFGNMFGRSMFPEMGSGFHPLLPMGINFPSVDPTPFSDGNRGHWTSESFMTTTVNGVTQSVRKRRDWDGNEHVTRSFPDGQEVHTVNGVEQPPRGYISSRSGRESRHSPAPATVSQPHITSPRSPAPSIPAYPPPPYLGHSGGYVSPVRESEYRRHNRRFSETRPVIPDLFAPGPDTDHHKGGHRKRWWHSGQ